MLMSWDQILKSLHVEQGSKGNEGALPRQVYVIQSNLLGIFFDLGA